ncbi:peptidase inhibitor family I36 protein [Streptomyces sp. NBC_01077]
MSALLVGGAGISSAAEWNGSCENSEFCMYNGTSFTGNRADLVATPADDFTSFWGWDFPGTSVDVDNATSSSWNRTIMQIRLYENSNWGGSEVLHRASGAGCIGGTCPSYSGLGLFNNKASSMQSGV